MGGYDSDSSQEDYTETNTLLGFTSKEPGDDTISRLGGRPVCLSFRAAPPSLLQSPFQGHILTLSQEWIDPESPPSAALVRCGSCNDIMTLLLQLNGELPDRFPGHERWLYVFACRKPKCRRKEGSVRGLRSVKVSKEAAEAAREAEIKVEKEKKAREESEKKEREKQAGLGSALFGSGGGGAGANPFSAGGGGSNPFSSGSGASNPFSSGKNVTEKKEEVKEKIKELPKSFADALSLNNPQSQKEAVEPPKPEPWPEESALPKAYPPLYLVDVDYETLDLAPPPIPTNAQVEQVEMDEEPVGPAPSGKDDFESSMDAAFQKFADRMSQNPEQVIRYEFAGQPLIYSKDDAVAKVIEGGMPRCKGCGGGRVFELQLTPHAITELESEDMSLEGMDWGTIILGVCSADCQARGVEDGQVGYLEEWVGVQWEELAS